MSEVTKNERQFIDWLIESVRDSERHFAPGGQKVARIHWMPPSVRIRLERELRDHGLMNEEPIEENRPHRQT